MVDAHDRRGDLIRIFTVKNTASSSCTRTHPVGDGAAEDTEGTKGPATRPQ